MAKKAKTRSKAYKQKPICPIPITWRAKAGIDGISDALQVNDNRFAIGLRLVKDRVGGFVLVTVEGE